MAQTSHPRKMVIGRIGEFSDDSDWKHSDSRVNSTPVGAAGADVVFFGSLVALQTDGTIRRFTANSGVVAGVVALDDAYDIPQELGVGDDTGGSPGLKFGTVCTVARLGRMRVMIDEDVNVGDAVRFHCKSGVSGKRQGAFRTTDIAGANADTVLIATGAKWAEAGTVAAGAGAVLEFNVLNMTFTSDT